MIHALLSLPNMSKVLLTVKKQAFINPNTSYSRNCTKSISFPTSFLDLPMKASEVLR